MVIGGKRVVAVAADERIDVVAVVVAVVVADEVVAVVDRHLRVAADEWPLVVVLEEGAEVSGSVRRIAAAAARHRRRREVLDADVVIRNPDVLELLILKLPCHIEAYSTSFNLQHKNGL